MIRFDLNNIQAAASRIGEVPHLEALSCIPEFFRPVVDNGFSSGGPSEFKAAVFNIEQGTRLRQIIPFLQHHPELADVDIILANELDCGMRRSMNQDITRELAKALNMNYAYGIEFITVSAGKDGNGQGLHGNAILSKYPFTRCKIINLPIEFDWFYMPGDPRLGTRNAVLAQIELAPGRPLGLVCAHLENRTGPEGRLRQMSFLLDEVDSWFGGIPVLIGGDMNTNTVNPNIPGGMELLDQQREEQVRRLGEIPSWEPLMDYAASRGYAYSGCNVMSKATRRKPMPGGSIISLNLDWFFQKGLRCSGAACVKSILRVAELAGAPEDLTPFEGMELSDHDVVVVKCGVEE